MKKVKYFIVGFIFLLFLNSCGYFKYVYDQIIFEANERSIAKALQKKDKIDAINNSKYRKDIENILIDIEKRKSSRKIIFEDLELKVPEGVNLKSETFIDEKTGYGLPLRIYSLDKCEGYYRNYRVKYFNKKYYVLRSDISLDNDKSYSLFFRVSDENGFKNNCGIGR
ncbi:hypothetical protein [Leptotrichia alba]|uniref:Lipoprotein n=1 Tax=Leptotrichia alba TaxID=3239304 RepID=A0AB39V217_9FUSO